MLWRVALLCADAARLACVGLAAGARQAAATCRRRPPPPEHPGDAAAARCAGLFVGDRRSPATGWTGSSCTASAAPRRRLRWRSPTDGVHVEREGVPDLYLPDGVVERASLGDALAGKVIGKAGMLAARLAARRGAR